MNPIRIALALLCLAPACDNKMSGSTDMGPAGGPVTGALDTHCNADGGVRKQPVDPAVCKYRPDGGMATGDYGDTLWNAEGNDDDCKYHVVWSAATPIYRNTDVTLALTLTTLADGKAATGAEPYIEPFLSDMHAGPGTNQKATEDSPGHYKIGPIRFDEAGKWTIRFHVHGDCYDYAEESPHGHIAFFVNVP